MKGSVYCVFCCVLVACGGGGGSSSTSSPPSTPPPSAPPSSTGNWGDPNTISSASGGAGEVQVAIDDAGNAIAVWLQLNSSGVYAKSLWGSRYVAGSGWSNPALIENGNADIRDFKLVMRSDSGRATVLWSQLTSASNFDVWARTFNPASGWDAITQIEFAPGEVSAASAGIDANGVTLAVWSQIQNFRFHVWSSRNTPGMGWSSPVLIETHDVLGDTDLGARIAVLSSGDALAVWRRSTGTSTSLWTNTYRTASGWGSESLLVADAGSSFSLDTQQSIVADASGGALLVWGQWQFANGQQQSTVVAKRYAAGWQIANVEIATPVSSTTISTPFIAVNASGASAVVWQRADISLQSSVAAAGGIWSIPYALRPAGSRDLKGEPSIAIDSAGNVLAAWASLVTNVGDADLIVQRYSASAGWSAAQTLHTLEIDADASSPALAMNAEGDAVIAYIETTSASGSRVVVRNYRVP